MNRVDGVICPIVTPLTVDGNLHRSVLGAHIESLINDLDGLLINGSTGESPWLLDDVSDDAARVAADVVAGRVPIYRGVADFSTSRVIDRIRRISLGDVLLVTPPMYHGVDHDGVARHYLEVAEASSKPILLYNNPRSSGTTIDPRVVETIAGHPNILGIKDSSGDPFLFLDYLRTSRRASFSVAQGREELWVFSLLHGARAVVSSMANYAPRLLREARDTYDDNGHASRLHELAERIVDLARINIQGYWLTAVKAAVSECGFEGNGPSSPIPSCTSEQLAAIRSILDEHRGFLVAPR